MTLLGCVLRQFTYVCYVCMYVCMYACMYICMYACVYYVCRHEYIWASRQNDLIGMCFAPIHVRLWCMYVCMCLLCMQIRVYELGAKTALMRCVLRQFTSFCNVCMYVCMWYINLCVNMSVYELRAKMTLFGCVLRQFTSVMLSIYNTHESMHAPLVVWMYAVFVCMYLSMYER